MKIILLMGVIGSGKDYYAQQYKAQVNTETVIIKKFATPIVEIANLFSPVNLQDSLIYENWKQSVENRFSLIKLSILLKKYTNQTIFSTMAANDADRTLTESVVNKPITLIYTDCRFVHEVKALKEIAKKHNATFSVQFCNYKSERYQLSPAQPTEKLAIKLLSDLSSDAISKLHPTDITDFILNIVDNPLYQFDQ